MYPIARRWGRICESIPTHHQRSPRGAANRKALLFLTAQDPSNAEWQHDLGANHMGLGTVLEAHGGIGSLGPFTDVGTPKECTALGLTGAGGMSLVGQINSFHANLELDVVSLMHLECE